MLASKPVIPKLIITVTWGNFFWKTTKQKQVPRPTLKSFQLEITEFGASKIDFFPPRISRKICRLPRFNNHWSRSLLFKGAPGTLLEMKNLRPHPRSTKSESGISQHLQVHGSLRSANVDRICSIHWGQWVWKDTRVNWPATWKYLSFCYGIWGMAKTSKTAGKM